MERFRGDGNSLHKQYSKTFQTHESLSVSYYFSHFITKRQEGAETITSWMSNSYLCRCPGKFTKPLEEPLVVDLIFTGPWGQIIIQKTEYCITEAIFPPQLWRWSSQNPKTGTSVLHQIPGLQMMLLSRENLHYHKTAYFPVLVKRVMWEKTKQNTHIICIFLKITQHYMITVYSLKRTIKRPNCGHFWWQMASLSNPLGSLASTQHECSCCNFQTWTE